MWEQVVDVNNEGIIDVGDYDDVYTGFPLFLHGRYYFATDRWSPYVGANVGLYFTSKKAYLNRVWEGYEVDDATNLRTSAFVDFNFGFNHRLGDDAQNELSIYAGLKLMNARCVYVAALPSYD